MKKNIYDYPRDALDLKPAFVARQLFNWLYVKYENEFSKMLNLSKAMREKLEAEYTAGTLTKVHEARGALGTAKYLFRTTDGYTFESVFIKMRDAEVAEDGDIIKQAKYTFCISSQIGCKVGCAFCMTGKGAFGRNLSAGEIVEQVLLLKKLNNLPFNKSVNIVYMGMGEPLHNFDNVISSVKIITDELGLNIAPRRITISTSGIAPRVKELGRLNLGVQLALSLHAVTDSLRNRLVPINRAYNIKETLDAIRAFPVDARKRIMFEYIIIDDVNDSLAEAKELLRLLNGIKAKVNLILFNPHEGSEFRRPKMSKVKTFADYLISKGQLATIRESKGLDIDAACGQLKEKVEREASEGEK